jgi:hypothetical protein
LYRHNDDIRVVFVSFNDFFERGETVFVAARTPGLKAVEVNHFAFEIGHIYGFIALRQLKQISDSPRWAFRFKIPRS